MKFQHFQPQKEAKFGPHPFYLPPRTSDFAKAEKKDTNFSIFQKMHSMIPSRKAQNLEHKGGIFPFFHTLHAPQPISSPFMLA